MIQYLVSIVGASKSAQINDLESQLLQTNPILEGKICVFFSTLIEPIEMVFLKAFGNAKTMKNDNSSRFGKFIRIFFDQSGYVIGGSIETYLLEKSRVIRQAKEERTFHIFYQLLRGADQKMIQDYLLDDFRTYRYLNNGGLTINGVQDVDEFKNTMKAMKTLNLSSEELHGIFRTLSSILQFGNLRFKQERNSDQVVLLDDTVAQKICHFVGLPITELIRAFSKPKIKVGRDHVVKTQTEAQVNDERERLVPMSSRFGFFFQIFRFNLLLKPYRKPFMNDSFVGWSLE